MKIVITGGPTREAIDGIRFITNRSSGRTGSFLADFFTQKHWQVTYLHGFESMQPVSPQIRKVCFQSFDDLNERLREELKKESYQAIVHSAAVSDYSVSDVRVGEKTFKPSELEKLDSSADVFIHLRRNFKIIDQLRSYSGNPEILVVGFKLTNTADIAKRLSDVTKLSQNRNVDYVVHNDASEVSEIQHKTQIFRGTELLYRGNSKQDLARDLHKILTENISCA